MSSIDIGDMEVKKLDMSKIDDVIQLDDNLSVKMGFITREIERDGFRLAKKTTAKASESMRLAESTILIQALAIRSIITPDGEDTEVSVKDKQFFLEEIPQQLYEKITEWYEANNFGVDFKSTVNCLSCDYDEEINIPMEDFFF